jgi:hypothetical protein
MEGMAMMKTIILILSAAAAIVLAADPAGTAETAHRTHTEPTGLLGGPGA